MILLKIESIYPSIKQRKHNFLRELCDIFWKWVVRFIL